ncbi:MAG: hypothetical protein ACPGO5_01005 [Patescibacteria group bacterium]
MPEQEQKHVKQTLSDREVTTMMTAMYEMNRDILLTTKKIQKYIFWMRIMAVVKFVVIVIPVIFGLWYLSPYLSQMRQTFGLYGDLLGVDQKQEQQLDPETVDQINALMESKQLQQLLDVYRIAD